MFALDEIAEVVKEERHQQVADVHAVIVGVGGDDDFLVAEIFE